MNQPRLYHVNVTRRCALGCAHCYIDPKIRENGAIMSQGDFDAIVVAARKVHGIDRRPPEIHVIGGEPTLVPETSHRAYLASIQQHMDGVPHSVSLVSALASRQAARIARLYPRVITSWDAGARRHSQGLWLTQVNSVRDQGVPVHVAVTLSKSVLDFGVEKSLDYLHGTAGFDHIHLAPLIPTPAARSQAPDNSSVSQALIDSARWSVAHPSATVTPYAGLLLSGYGGYDELACPVRQDAVNIEPDLRLCSCVARAGMPDARILAATNIESAILSPAMRAEKVRHLRMPSHCMDCPHREVCQGGCRVAFEFRPFDASGECHGFSRFLRFMRAIAEKDTAVCRAC